MSSDRFIPGIYNYCDYWCERCAFTRRCRNFAMGREMERKARGEKAQSDATHKAFWDELAEQLSEASAAGRAGEWDDDMDFGFDDTPDPGYERRRERQEKAVDEHPLVVMSHAYMQKASSWLKTADKDLKTVAREMLQAAGAKFAAEDYEEQARRIGELIEVVAWCHTLIPPKIARAVGSLVEEKMGGDGEFADVSAEARRHDANGSGKVALAAIERSAAAWVGLREILPWCEDEILDMLATLSRLRSGIHTALPGAKSFVRPGFDEDPPGIG